MYFHVFIFKCGRRSFKKKKENIMNINVYIVFPRCFGTIRGTGVISDPDRTEQNTNNPAELMMIMFKRMCFYFTHVLRRGLYVGGGTFSARSISAEFNAAGRFPAELMSKHKMLKAPY